MDRKSPPPPRITAKKAQHLSYSLAESGSEPRYWRSYGTKIYFTVPTQIRFSNFGKPDPDFTVQKFYFMITTSPNLLEFGIISFFAIK